jgi:hypothetical protein
VHAHPFANFSKGRSDTSDRSIREALSVTAACDNSPRRGDAEPDFLPVVKPFTRDHASCTWLLSGA